MAIHSRLPASLAGVLVAGAVLATAAASAADAPAGERWRVTTSMEMMGMKMPGRTMEICKEADAPPVAPEKNCQTTEVRRSGNTIHFRMHCTGENAAEVEGTSTLIGPDHSRTVMHMTMAQGEMTMNSEGEKLGACTGGEANIVAKKEVAKLQAMGAKAQAQAQQQQAQQCAEAARAASSPYLITQVCKDPATVKTYCANFQTHEPFRKQAEEEARTRQSGSAVPSGLEAQMLPLSTSAKLCGADVRKVREHLCSTAEAQGHMAFIATQCPALARTIAAREQCAGRGYTSVPANYQAICGSVAQAANADDAGSGAPAQASKVCVDAARTADSPELMKKECRDPATVATYCAGFQTLDAFRRQAEREAQLLKAGSPASDRTRPLTTSLELCQLDRDAVLGKLCAKAREQGDSAFVASQCADVAAEPKKPGVLNKGKKILGGLLGN